MTSTPNYKPLDDALLQAMAQTIREFRLTVDRFMKKAPRGFWDQVKVILGDSDPREKGALNAYWKREVKEGRLVNELRELLGEAGSVIDVTVVSEISAEEGGLDVTVTRDVTGVICSAIEEERASVTGVTPDVIETAAGEEIPQSHDGELPLPLNAKDSEGDLILSSEGALLYGEMLKMEARILEFVESRLTAAPLPSQEMKSTPPVDGLDEPPAPKKTGKKLLGTRKHLHGLVDSKLSEKLNDWAEEHHGGNLSQALTVILWRFFDRPLLSYQMTGEPEPSPADAPDSPNDPNED
jgi:hypothetical protein